MSDEEILKRLAEIEGHPLCEEWDCGVSPGIQIGTGEGDLTLYNPLTNWSDLGLLIEKYRLNICPPFDGSSTWRADVLGSTGDAGIHKSLPHAICLAILAAREEGNEWHA